jgi:hypothetical protein
MRKLRSPIERFDQPATIRFTLEHSRDSTTDYRPDEYRRPSPGGVAGITRWAAIGTEWIASTQAVQPLPQRHGQPSAPG